MDLRETETKLCRACAEPNQVRTLCYRCGVRAAYAPEEIVEVFPEAAGNPYIRSGVGVAIAYYSDAGCPQCGKPEEFSLMRYHNFILVLDSEVSA